MDAGKARTANSHQPLILNIVTTTTVPYMYHVPAILGIPAGMSYWFRYLTQYLHLDLRDLAAAQVPKRGLLHLRDNSSDGQLCFPLREFEVLWFDRSETVCFLNLLMTKRVAYGSAAAPVDPQSSAPAGLDQSSWRLLAEHIEDCRVRARRTASTNHLPKTVAVPRQGSPPIVPWKDLRPADAGTALVWVAAPVPAPQEPSLRQRISAPRDVPNREHERWRSMLPAFAAMERVNKTPFFFLHAPVAVASGRRCKPTEIGGGEARYSHGFATRADESYRVRVDEITPHAFCDDVPTSAPFRLSIGKSDSAVRPFVKEADIDGPYGYYELSFDLDSQRAGTHALLRLSTEGLQLPAGETPDAGSMAPPDIVVPLVIRRRVLRDLAWALAGFFAIVAFVSPAQWMPYVGIEPESATAKLVLAFLFGLALFFAKKAGIGELAGNVGEKV